MWQMPRLHGSYASEVWFGDMELRHLRYFRAVAELRSVSKAANVLHLTQPALSRQIMELERQLGSPLFRRTSRGVDLTPAGAGLYGHLDALFAQVERIPEIVRTASETKALVTVGLPQGLPHDWFLDLLEAVEHDLPEVALSLQEATTDEQRQLLQQGLLDLALIHLEPDEGPRLLLLEQVMGIGVPPHSPLTGRTEIGFADLDGLTVMAHAVGEIAAEESRLRAASAAAQADTNWIFRRFSEHSWLIARTAHVDGVLVTQASIARHFRGWVWIPVRATADGRHNMDLIRTWATWKEPAAPPLRALLGLLRARAVGSHASPVQQPGTPGAAS